MAPDGQSPTSVPLLSRREPPTGCAPRPYSSPTASQNETPSVSPPHLSGWDPFCASLSYLLCPDGISFYNRIAAENRGTRALGTATENKEGWPFSMNLTRRLSHRHRHLWGSLEKWVSPCRHVPLTINLLYLSACCGESVSGNAACCARPPLQGRHARFRGFGQDDNQPFTTASRIGSQSQVLNH